MICEKGYPHNHAKMALVIYCTLQMLSGSRSSPFMPWNVPDSQQRNTGDFQFPNISFDFTSPIHKNLPHKKNGKGHILTLMSNKK